jgi:ABC-type branched-subunit amino acid transport system substrate-binding protein
MERAARLAVQEINDAGGIYVSSWNTKVNITLVLADTVNDAPANAVTPVTRAVETDNVDMLIGGYGSAGTLANEIVAIENKVPYKQRKRLRRHELHLPLLHNNLSLQQNSR